MLHLCKCFSNETIKILLCFCCYGSSSNLNAFGFISVHRAALHSSTLFSFSLSLFITCLHFYCQQPSGKFTRIRCSYHELTFHIAALLNDVMAAQLYNVIYLIWKVGLMSMHLYYLVGSHLPPHRITTYFMCEYVKLEKWATARNKNVPFHFT